MKRTHLIPTAILLVFTTLSLALLADRGTGKKSKVRTSLSITANKNSFKESVFLNLSNGLNYKGSYSASHKTADNLLINSSLTTYQKGNTTFIIPYKSKIAVADIQPGYSGVKLLIRSGK